MLGEMIRTERLVLRPIGLDDLSSVHAAAGRREVADTMISIPHPFSTEDAERYVRSRIAAMRLERGAAFTLWTHAPTAFIGLVELREIDREHALAELSFWLAIESRGRGYMAEALDALLRYAFEDLGLNRVYAYHMVRNPASGRVLARLGFAVEGILRQRVRKWGLFEDVVLQALLRAE
jgi:[ribosomal protein S5]-alanine N-acetyltransferase